MRPMPASLEEQAANCFKNLQTVLDTAGFKTSDVLKVTVYIKSQANRQLVNPPWLAMFPDEHNRPARHQTVVETLNFDIQIEAFAVKESRVLTPNPSPDPWRGELKASGDVANADREFVANSPRTRSPSPGVWRGARGSGVRTTAWPYLLG